MAKPNTYQLILMLVAHITISCSSNVSSTTSNSTVSCLPLERAALLNFKRRLTFFNSTVSSSWETGDCCTWSRVSCDLSTGHILELHLHGIPGSPLLKLHDSKWLVYFIELKQLQYLDLSNNYINAIPKFVGSMKQLRYLNLSSIALLEGSVPHELGNLTNLRVLDLSTNINDLLIAATRIIVDSLGWVAGLPELRYLDMSWANMSQAIDWMDSLIGPLPYLRELHLANCGLTLHKYAHKNSSLPTHPIPIRYLDLSYNNLEGEIPRILYSFTSLEHLDLSNNELTSKSFVPLDDLQSSSIEGGDLWGLLQRFCSLRYLDMSRNKLPANFLKPHQSLSNRCNHYNLEELHMSDNNLIGDIPAALSNLSALRILNSYNNSLSFTATSLRLPSNLEIIDLSYNQLSGRIVTSIGQLTKLQSLDIGSNPMEGTTLSEIHFANLSSLTSMYMEDTFLTLDLPSDWVPPFQLQEFYAGTCKLNGHFPRWLQTQTQLQNIQMYDANISGPMPKWLHTMKLLEFVDLSNNQISGTPIFPINFLNINLSNNSLFGPLISIDTDKSTIYSNALLIHVSDNSISGTLPQDFGRLFPNLQVLYLSNNSINGLIPKSLSLLNSLYIVDLRMNRLSGLIPNLWTSSIDGVTIVNLSYNKLEGRLPCFSTTGSRTDNVELVFLHLSNNMLSGEIPSCLMDTLHFQLLDIGGNQLSGKITTWISSENFGALKILRLRGNNFSGTIPPQICSLSQLTLLDLGHNHFTGPIPYCLNNLIATSSYSANIEFDAGNNDDEVNEVIQGIERAYTSTLKYLVNIDLSCNNLVGSIPTGITNLSGLLSLNLSYNHLSGTISENIGDMKSLISLDLSRNELGGMIPRSIVELYELSHLNLSYNNLSGQIPTGSQLQTLIDPSIYAGNPGLCGDLLPKKCKSNNVDIATGSTDQDNGDGEDKYEKLWLYLFVMSGLATGFWGVVGSLWLKRSWRHALFRRVEDAYDWVYVAVAVRMAKLKGT